MTITFASSNSTFAKIKKGDRKNDHLLFAYYNCLRKLRNPITSRADNELNRVK